MPEFYYDIRGPGLLRALQRAVSAKKDLGFVYDHDNLGRILRVGYFFKGMGTGTPPQPEITWFKSGEIRVTLVPTQVREFRQACLEVGFVHPRANERHFLLMLTLGPESRVILRNLFRIHRNRVKGFVIQAEIRSVIGGEEIWRPVVRYDCAHGFIHRDMIASDGRKTKYRVAAQGIRNAIATN